MDHVETSLVCRFCGVFACFGQIVSVAPAGLQLTRASSTIAATAIATSDAAAAPVRKPSAQCSTSRNISGQLIMGCLLIKVISNYERLYLREHEPLRQSVRSSRTCSIVEIKRIAGLRYGVISIREKRVTVVVS
jgi:hypothetical protein